MLSASFSLAGVEGFLATLEDDEGSTMVVGDRSAEAARSMVDGDPRLACLRVKIRAEERTGASASDPWAFAFDLRGTGGGGDGLLDVVGGLEVDAILVHGRFLVWYRFNGLK